MTSQRVVIPLMSFNPSGGVRTVLAVANGLADNNIGVRVYVPNFAAAPPTEVHPSVEIVSIHAGTAARRIGYIFKLIRKLSRENGLCISTGYQTPLYIYLSRLLSGRRIRMVNLIQSYEPLTHVRYGSQPALLKPLLHAIARLGYRLPGYKIAVSEFVARRVGSRRIDKVINPGIGEEFVALLQSAHFEGPPDKKPAREAGAGKMVVGFFPSTGRVKGIRYAIDAFDRLGGGDAEVEFLVYDADFRVDDLPAYVRRFSECVEAEGLAASRATNIREGLAASRATNIREGLAASRANNSRVRAPSIVRFYRACDVFLFPSLAEGFGLPPLEAMACGTPVVLTDSGGVMTYARDGENCIVIPPRSGAAIAEAIKRIAADSDLARRLAAGGLNTAREYSRERFVRSCVEEISRLL